MKSVPVFFFFFLHHWQLHKAEYFYTDASQQGRCFFFLFLFFFPSVTAAPLIQVLLHVDPVFVSMLHSKVLYYNSSLASQQILSTQLRLYAQQNFLFILSFFLTRHTLKMLSQLSKAFKVNSFLDPQPVAYRLLKMRK